MAANYEVCCIHYQHTAYDKNPLIKWSQEQLENALSKAKDWVLLDKQPEQQIATEFLRIREIRYHQNAYDHDHNDIDSRMEKNDDNRDKHSFFYAHKLCYLRFASMTKLLAAQRVHTRRNVSVKMIYCDCLLYFQVQCFCLLQQDNLFCYLMNMLVSLLVLVV